MDKSELFIALLLGHLVGDYFMQSDVMAINKRKNDWLGYVTCTGHCIVYTMWIVIFLKLFKIPVGFFSYTALFIFLTHFFPDKYGWASKWMKFYGITVPKKPLPSNRNVAFRREYCIIIQVVIDNTMHLILMYFGILEMVQRGWLYK